MHVLHTPYLNPFGGIAKAKINTPTMIYMLA